MENSCWFKLGWMDFHLYIFQIYLFDCFMHCYHINSFIVFQFSFSKFGSRRGQQDGSAPHTDHSLPARHGSFPADAATPGLPSATAPTTPGNFAHSHRKCELPPTSPSDFTCGHDGSSRAGATSSSDLPFSSSVTSHTTSDCPGYFPRASAGRCTVSKSRGSSSTATTGQHSTGAAATVETTPDADLSSGPSPATTIWSIYHGGPVGCQFGAPVSGGEQGGL